MTEFKPPKRQPGDPPWKYGNDIPKSYLKSFKPLGDLDQGPDRDPMDVALDEALKASRRKNKETDDGGDL